MSKVTVLNGSPSGQTRLNGVLDYVVKHFEAASVSHDVIHIRNLPAEDLIQANFNSQGIKAANKKIEGLRDHCHYHSYL